LLIQKDSYNSKLDFQTILSTDNLASILSEETKTLISSEVMTRYNTDLQSRSEKQKVLQDLVKCT